MSRNTMRKGFVPRHSPLCGVCLPGLIHQHRILQSNLLLSDWPFHSPDVNNIGPPELKVQTPNWNNTTCDIVYMQSIQFFQGFFF